MWREDSLAWLSGRILKWLLSVGILNFGNSRGEKPSAPVGDGVRRLFRSDSGVHDDLGEPTTISQLKLVEAIDIRMQSDRINSSSGLPSVRVKRPDRVDSRETLDR